MFDTYSFVDPELPDSDLVEKLGLRQPSFLDGLVQLKAPQLLAQRFGKHSKRYILSLDKGMGKTLTYLLAAHESGAKRVIILCTRNAMLTQRREIRRFFKDWEDCWTFVSGTTAERKQQWLRPCGIVFIMTYATYLADIGVRAKSTATIAPQWAIDMSDEVFCICDEYHKVLRNKGTKMHKALKDAAPWRLILSSGSAANKGPQSMWTALNVCDPKLWSSYWKYVNTYCEVIDGRFGKEILGVKNVRGWRNAIAPYVFHRRKDSKDYPTKTRSLLEATMEPWQKHIHDKMHKELLVFLRGGETALVAQNKLEATIKLRQLMICPKFLDESLGWGCYLEAILDDINTAELKHVVVTVPLVGPIPLIRQFFSVNGFNVWSLQGGMKLEDIAQSIELWQKNGGVMIQSAMFAESYELPPARVMYMLGYLYDPGQNEQAEDRIHRDIRVTPDPVDIYYLLAEGAYDRKILDALAFHADNVYALLNKPASQLAEVFS